MVEQGRHAQIQALEAKGWRTDRETDWLQQWEIERQSVGGPEYLRAPDGRIYECSCGVERLVVGEYVRGDQRRLYRAGKAVDQ